MNNYSTTNTLSDGTKSKRLDEKTWLHIMKDGWYGFWDNKTVKEFGSYVFDYEYLIEKANLVERRNKNEFNEVTFQFLIENDTTKDGSVECAVKTESKMLFGLITPYEYMRASTDKDCVTASSKACQNYNYLLYADAEWTITTVASDNYNVFAFDTDDKWKTYINDNAVRHLNCGINDEEQIRLELLSNFK